MSYKDHFKKECEVLGWPGDCEMQQMVVDNVNQLLDVFAEQGHSGSSAPYVMDIFKKAASFAPLSALTGNDDEWVEHADGHFQNIRNSAVFKNGKDGTAYWLNGKIFREPSGSCYTSGESKIDIEFPWEMPESEIIDVKDES